MKNNLFSILRSPKAEEGASAPAAARPAAEKTAEEKFTTPEVGDTVNYVHHGRAKISKVKVLAVDDKTEGRLVTVEVPVIAKNKDGDQIQTTEKRAVTYRPKSKLAGHTWHLVLALAIGLLAMGDSARANIPTYHMFSATGTHATPAFVIMPADPNSQIRVVSVFFQSDTNIAYLNLSSGVTAYSVYPTNAQSGFATTTTVTNNVDSTNGFTPSSVLVLQHGGTCYSNLLSSWGTYISGTNTFGYITNQAYVATIAGGFGVAPSPGDEIYQMGPVSSVYLGAATNAIDGDDIFSGNYGRPVMASITPCEAADALTSVGTHYDSASQP